MYTAHGNNYGLEIRGQYVRPLYMATGGNLNSHHAHQAWVTVEYLRSYLDKESDAGLIEELMTGSLKKTLYNYETLMSLFEEWNHWMPSKLVVKTWARVNEENELRRLTKFSASANRELKMQGEKLNDIKFWHMRRQMAKQKKAGV